MATDASFEKIGTILAHDNSDNLEIAMVSNYPCVVRKGEFKPGDTVFYIRDDAKLIGFDEYRERQERDKEARNTGDFVTQDTFTCTWPWQENLFKYLGGGGRVRSIRLRGKISMGILLKCEDVLCWKTTPEEENAKIIDPDRGEKYLEQFYGVSHWNPPTVGFGSMDVKCAALPCGLKKTDEDNWENIEESDLHLGNTCLVTKKLDGTSTTVTCYPDGKYDISSRSMTFNVEKMRENNEENIYTKFTGEAVKAGLWWAKKTGHVIALRGETCCGSVQKSSYNKDCLLEGFFVYRCEFPEESNFYMKYGVFGTPNHFVNVVHEMNSEGFNVKTVPIIKEATITRDLLSTYNDAQWEFGEGVVVNVKAPENFLNETYPDSTVWSYKSKSREYLLKMK